MGNVVMQCLQYGALVSKKWQLTPIVANPYQDGGKHSVYYGWCTRPFFTHPDVKGKKPSSYARLDYYIKGYIVRPGRYE